MPTLTQLPTGEDDDEHTNEIEFRRRSEKFVGDFNKFFKDLEAWTSNDIHIQTWKDHFLKEYPKMFGDSSGTEMDVDIDTTMKTKPPIEREEKLRKVEEKLLSKRTNERFTDCDRVMSDDKLSLSQKVIYLQRAIDDVTRRKIYYASLQGQLLEECFFQLKKVYKETLEETKIMRQWSIFLRKLYKLVLDYNQIIYCTVPLSYVHSNFKIIRGICECNKERWK